MAYSFKLYLIILYNTCIVLTSFGQSNGSNLRWADYINRPMTKTFQSAEQQNKSYFMVKAPLKGAKNILLERNISIMRILDKEHFVVFAHPEILLKTPQIEQIWNINNNWKLSSEKIINTFDDVLVLTVKVTDSEVFIREMSDILKKPLHLISESFISVQCTKAELNQFLLPRMDVEYIGLEAIDPQTESRVIDLNINPNTINRIHHTYPELNGMGMTISIQEPPYHVNDIDLIGRHIPSDVIGEDESDHATEMATIAAGAGNSFITGKGVAWQSNITSSDFRDIFPDSDQSYQTLDVTVQNHSYGTKIENFYGGRAELFDLSANNNPTLLHVFSSGNLGLEADTLGPYTGVNGLATLTGNFKMAKNILVVGSADTVGRAISFVSKGPTHDGRVRPEVVAYSMVGSSNSAALVSGLSILLQQQYKTRHGTNPPSALTKALIINSAKDEGIEHVDYFTGFGSVDGFRAIENLKSDRFISGELVHGENFSATVDVPDDAVNLKVTLVWNDPAAPANSNIALINDLDMTLIDPDNNTWQPWTLNRNPDSLSLVQKAERGRDDRNNVEQITLAPPISGSYQVNVHGFDVPEGPQKFHIAYQWDTDQSFEWNFPTGSDNMPYNGETVGYFRWKSTLSELRGDLEYSIDNGITWTDIVNDIDLSTGLYRWDPPEITSSAIARMVVDGITYPTESFTISRPMPVNVGFNCTDSVLIQWNSVTNAIHYEIQTMGSTLLESAFITTDTSIIISKVDYPTPFFSIQAILENDVKPVKSVTFDYNALGSSCYLIAFFPNNIDDDGIHLFLELGTTFGVEEVIIERQEDEQFVSIATISDFDSLTLEFLDTTPIQGYNVHRARILLNNGVEIISEQVESYFLTEVPFLLFPNPVSNSDNLFVFSKIFDQGVKRVLTLYDRNGHIIKSGELQSEQDFISIAGLVPGLYFYSIDVEGKRYTGKVIIL